MFTSPVVNLYYSPVVFLQMKFNLTFMTVCYTAVKFSSLQSITIKP